MKKLLLFLSVVLISFGCKKKYELQILLSPSEGGIVSPESGKYEEGEEVTIRLTPLADHRFIEWRGDWSGTENPLTITMDRDYSIVGVLQSPIFLDKNGVTIKCRSWCEVGESYEFNGKTYTIVDENMLKSIVRSSNENEDLTNYCTSKIVDMQSMFNRTSFNGDISNWDVSNVRDMVGMFAHSSFNQDLSSWDVSNVMQCYCFMCHNNSWTLPRPNFTNCECDCN
jgi:surface protein